jgi:hypothetical protein
MTSDYFDKLPNGYHLMSIGNSDTIYTKNNKILIATYKIINGNICPCEIKTEHSFCQEYEDIIIENKITNKLNRIFRLEQLQEKINEI